MAFFSGTDGELQIADQTATTTTGGELTGQRTIAKTRSWTFNSTTEILDTASLGDTDRTHRVGLRSATGSADILYYTTSDNTGNITELLNFALGDRDPGSGGISEDGPEKFTIKFKIGRSGNKNRYIICKVTITDLQITSSVGEITSATLSFAASGAPQEFFV